MPFRFLIAISLLALALTARGNDTVAVWDFDNNTVGPIAAIQSVDHLVRFLPDTLASRLTGLPGLRIVERNQLRKILEEQKLGSSSIADQESRLKLGRILGAKAMIFGEYVALGGLIRADIRLVDVETSEILASAPIMGSEAELLPEVDAFASRIAERYSTHRAKQLATPLPPQVMGIYESGLQAMEKGNFDVAIDSFQRVLKAAPDFSDAERQLVMALEKSSRAK